MLIIALNQSLKEPLTQRTSKDWKAVLQPRLVRRVKQLAQLLPVRLVEFQNFIPSDIQRAPTRRMIPS
jgi:hypothetical protein